MQDNLESFAPAAEILSPRFSLCPACSARHVLLLKLVFICFSGPVDVLPLKFNVGNYSEARGVDMERN